MATQPDVLLTGDLGFEKHVIKAKHDGFTVDFSGATLHSEVYPKPKNAIPLVIDLNGHDDVVVRGGTVIRHDDPDTTWRQSYKPVADYIHSSGLHLYKGDGSVTVDGLRLHNTHDGIVIASTISDEKYITVRHVYATHIRDDAIENDGMKNVVVEDSLFDGVFVGFSAVSPKTSSKPGNVDPVVTIRDTLVRMENMAGDPTRSTTDDGWGHGRLFKWWDGRSPELVLENNIFVVEDRDAWDDSVNMKIVHSENNIMIWMGEGDFRGKLPAGFTLIEGNDRAFREARDAWLERHGYDPKGSLKDNLHAPVLDGAKPAPEPAPAPEPDVGLVANWMLDADLNGNQQKVVIEHDASLQLDQGSVALTFTADRVSGVQSLLSKDSMGFDDGGHLSIWLKEGQVVARLQSDSQSYQLSSDPGVIKAGAASQVAVSFGDEGFRLYVGADLVDQSPYTGGIAQNSEPVVLGASAQRSSDGKADNLTDFFKGTISELAVYNKQLSLSQPEPEPEPAPAPEPDFGLVANWMLDVGLNGNQQKVVIDHDASLQLAQGSVALTFTADRVSGVQSLVSKDSMGFDDGGHLSIWLKDGQVVARLQSDSQSYQLSSDPGVIKAGAASQVAVSFGDEGFRLYVGEDLVDQSPYTGGIAQNSEPVVLGASAQRSSDGKADNLTDFFKGTISELAVYDEELGANLGILADHLFLA